MLSFSAITLPTSCHAGWAAQLADVWLQIEAEAQRLEVYRSCGPRNLISSACGRKATFLKRPLVLALIKLLSVPPFLKRRPLRYQDNGQCFLILCALTVAELLEDF